MNEKWDEIQGKLNLVRVSGECELSEFETPRGSALQVKVKKPVKLIVQTTFAEKLKQKGAWPSKTSFLTVFFNGRL